MHKNFTKDFAENFVEDLPKDFMVKMSHCEILQNLLT